MWQTWANYSHICAFVVKNINCHSPKGSGVCSWEVTVDLAESNSRLPPGLRLTSHTVFADCSEHRSSPESYVACTCTTLYLRLLTVSCHVAVRLIEWLLGAVSPNNWWPYSYEEFYTYQVKCGHLRAATVILVSYFQGADVILWRPSGKG